MKKIITITVLGLGLLISAGAYAQDAAQKTAGTKEKTEKVINNIPSLNAIAQEITAFQMKIKDREQEYKNASADLKALKQKYANELTAQISLNEGKEEIVDVLREELKKTNKEIENLK